MSQSLKKTFARNTKDESKKDPEKKKLCRNRGYWYSFTLNNPDPETIDLLSQGKFGNLRIEKLICQEEEGEEKGTFHLQGTVKFKNQTEFSSVKANMPRAHIEKTRNIMASMQYCSKLATRAGKITTFGNVAKMISGKKPQKLTDKEICKAIRELLEFE